MPDTHLDAFVSSGEGIGKRTRGCSREDTLELQGLKIFLHKNAHIQVSWTLKSKLCKRPHPNFPEKSLARSFLSTKKNPQLLFQHSRLFSPASILTNSYKDSVVRRMAADPALCGRPTAGVVARRTVRWRITEPNMVQMQELFFCCIVIVEMLTKQPRDLNLNRTKRPAGLRVSQTRLCNPRLAKANRVGDTVTAQGDKVTVNDVAASSTSPPNMQTANTRTHAVKCTSSHSNANNILSLRGLK
ncbi:hypothetical protein KSP39_PZI017381 [Platanthera zijinensis]|uniref:Uncharacterized protein n=1 Tax=Platanthera zijinensis TaxID=2320716 RepID=A0AAP0B742_9ASPA